MSSTAHRLGAAGIRLHQFVTGALPAVAYLADWVPPAWLSLILTALAVCGERFALVGRLRRGAKPSYGREDPGPSAGLFRLNEVVRALLLGTGLVFLATGRPLGWLPVLAAASISILEGTTAFSFMLLMYAGAKKLAAKARRPKDAAPLHLNDGNPNCIVCRALEGPPYGRCRWCRLSSIRWCCGLQTSLLLVLLLVIAFLLNAQLTPLVTKILVTMSILGLVTLALAISRQTDDLIGSLNRLDDAHRRIERRCEFLKRLAMADSLAAAADAVVAYACQTLIVQRVSVMVVEDGKLRIVGFRGIPEEVAAAVEVPTSERICGQVFSSGTPVVFGGEGCDHVCGTLGLGAGAAASYPLVAAGMKTAGRKVGVINVTDRPMGDFSADDLEELQFIAEAAAISLSSQLDRRDLERANYAAISSLALTIEAKDPCTHGHSQRVRTWAATVARELGILGPRLQALTYAAELHDIGKLAIPDNILKAARKLSPHEWAVIKEHPQRGAELVRHLTFLEPAIAAILYHHERLDGAGYPEGLSGDEIPLEARILAVIDAYDAMTSARPYRPPMSHEEAAAELRRAAGTQFDPECVETFLQLVGDAAAPAPNEQVSAEV